MNAKQLVDEVAKRTGLPRATVDRVLAGWSDAVVDALGNGDQVALRGIGRLEVQELAPRAIRRVDNQRKYYLGPRNRVQFRGAAQLKRALAERRPELWRDPKHQAAWRLAETLVADLALYHGAKAPSLERDQDAWSVQQQLQAAFGPLWDRVRKSYAAEVPAEINGQADYLAAAALRRWAR